MNMKVINKEISVGNIKIIEISSSSVLLIGDTRTITCASISEAPPEVPAKVPPR
ncbi:spore gernimation protein GerPD [Aneurinibacillus sp. Ricciae_BoGa-3]|nr:spore gernimation protein GerPD [Aneurinibacillus sp. Ricciae_BoGa-3]WCK55204.1 spore gernimation protein GerPD [Aneurinibacillus sp. Ricciae_BoGa-3]